MNASTDKQSCQLGSLRNQFLIAMPALSNSIFSHTITYICEHNDDGAMGLVINQPLNVSLAEIFAQMGFKGSTAAAPVLSGGPVQPERGFVLHSPDSQWNSSMAIAEDVMLTGSRDIIDAIATDKGPEKFLIMLGYAGWGSGQLENEIANNAWLTAAADSRIIFDTPIEQRWSSVAQNLGIDLNLISTTAGHA